MKVLSEEDLRALPKRPPRYWIKKKINGLPGMSALGWALVSCLAVHSIVLVIALVKGA